MSSVKTTVPVTLQVSQSDIESLIISAVESSLGSRYWIGKIDCDYTGEYFSAPFEGSSLKFKILEPINDTSKKLDYVLDFDAIKLGLSVMAEKCPFQFSRILDETSDAETGDVFLQCCLFGDVVFC